MTAIIESGVRRELTPPEPDPDPEPETAREPVDVETGIANVRAAWAAEEPQQDWRTNPQTAARRGRRPLTAPSAYMQRLIDAGRAIEARGESVTVTAIARAVSVTSSSAWKSVAIMTERGWWPWEVRPPGRPCRELQPIAEPAEPAASMVNHPPHYAGKVECIDAIEQALTQDEFLGSLKFQVVKYLWRAGRKGVALEDAHKARWYLDRLIATLEARP